MELNKEQKEAFEKITNFFDSKDTQVFILKGYAGTGKTTIIKQIIDWIGQRQRTFQLMASTGRAAKILKNKTGGNTSTIHRGIYDFDHIQVQETKELADMKIHYIFPIKNDRKTANQICIIDEASMVSSKKSESELFDFGTNIILDDILTYAKPLAGGKLLFVGDPAQLPPVGDNKSNALDEEYFRALGLNVESTELQTVVRQDKENLIFKNAMKIRDVLKSSVRNELSFETNDSEMIPVKTDEMVDKYCQTYPYPELGDSIIICYSNQKAAAFNKEIRSKLHKDGGNPSVGDILIVVNNHYANKLSNNNDFDIMNGEFAKVISINSEPETLTAPVYTEKGGIKKKEMIDLTFIDVTLQFENGSIANKKIIQSLLTNKEANFTIEETKALFISFRIRNSQIKVGTTSFSEKLRNDPFYNALRVKYGYAITGHKSQGGEWDTAFVDYTDARMDNDRLRWTYTVTTRARKTIFGVNMPDVNLFDKITISEIVKANNIPENFLPKSGNQTETKETPWHPQNSPSYLKTKYWETVQKLSQSGCQIKSIQSKHYREIYNIQKGDGSEIRFDVTYNSKGLFKPFTVTDNQDDSLLEILNSESQQNTSSFQYHPTNETLAKLYDNMKDACNTTNAIITNIYEDLIHYHILYCLKTSGKFSYIDFFFNNKGFISHATPHSDLGENDHILSNLLKLIHSWS